MNRSTRILLGVLGMVHLLVAIALLASVMFLGFFTIPIILPGLIWIAILGMRLLQAEIKNRTALLVTHSVLAPLSVLLVVYGFHCLEAAQRSSETGGGLLGTFGLIPIVIGALAGSLSVVSLCVVFSRALPGHPPDKVTKLPDRQR